MLLHFDRYNEDKEQDIDFANLYVTKIYQQFETLFRGCPTTIPK